MRRLAGSLWVGLGLAVLVWAGYALGYGERIRGYAIERIMEPSPIEDAAHAGDLVAGRELRQPIEWGRVTPLARAKRHEEPVCAALYFASFGDRRNRGSLLVEWVGSEVVEAVRVDMAEVRDNTFRTVCFEGVRLGAVIDRAAELRIRGVDGELGRSVTLWLSGHAGAPRAWVDGERDPRTLVYDLRVDAGNRREQIAGWVLILFAGLIMAVLVLAAFDRRLR